MRNMGNTGVLLVGFDAEASKVAAEAARRAFADAVVASAGNVHEALARNPASGSEVLALFRPEPADVTTALGAVDTTDLPRWAVVVLGARTVPAGVEALTPEEWTGTVVAHAFRSAIAQLALRRELARARGDLLAIGSRMTHDLRTQVAGILSTCELLKEILADEEPSRAELTQPIFDSVDGLGKIIERLAFLAKASARGPVKKRMDMGDVVFRALQRMDREIARKNASLVQPAFWPEVVCEPAWVEKIWRNLVANALKHGREAPRIELGWVREAREHRFWISDNGPGVHPELQFQLFQPFHLMHRTNSPRGMGLPIIQRLVEMQGGRCGYEPRKEGSPVFFFTMPAEAEAPNAAAVTGAVHAAGFSGVRGK
jgi:K+-sensing histidine kinase KdpD